MQLKRNLTDGEAEFIFTKLKSNYGFRQNMVFYGRGGHGRCGSWKITISHNPSVYLLAHEVTHALQWKSISYYHEKGKRWHTNKFHKREKKMQEFIENHFPEWEKEYDQRRNRMLESWKNQEEKKKSEEEYKKTDKFKLNHLKELEKKALTRFKRANTILNKVQKKIKNLERRIDRNDM